MSEFDLDDITLEDLENEMAWQSREMETWQDYDVARDMRIVRNINRKKAAMRVQAEREIDRINKWLKDKLEPLDRATESLETRMQAFYDYKLRDNPKTRIETPYGVMRTRTSKAWTYDEDKIMTMYPAFVKQTPKVDRAAIKKAFKPTFVAGEWLPIDKNGVLFEGATITEETKKYIDYEGDNGDGTSD